MKKYILSLETVLLALIQVIGFSFSFAIPITLLWSSTFAIFYVPFLPVSVTYFSIVGIIFILLTIFKIIKTLF